jgi:hypothetical protein
MRKRLEILPTRKKLEIIPRKKLEINYVIKTYPDNALLSEVKPIEEGGVHPQSTDHLETLVEYPLLDACKAFFEKGIETHMSSANEACITHGEAYIILFWDSLNEHNKEIAKQIGEYYEQMYAQNTRLLKISIPVNNQTTVGEIKQKFKEIVDRFESQK